VSHEPAPDRQQKVSLGDGAGSAESPAVNLLSCYRLSIPFFPRPIVPIFILLLSKNKLCHSLLVHYFSSFIALLFLLFIFPPFISSGLHLKTDMCQCFLIMHTLCCCFCFSIEDIFFYVPIYIIYFSIVFGCRCVLSVFFLLQCSSLFLEAH